MIRNKLLTWGCVVALVLCITTISCACSFNNLVGTYTASDQITYRGMYLTLNNNGVGETMGVAFNWERKGDKILITSFWGAEYYQLEGGNIITSDGILLIKQ